MVAPVWAFPMVEPLRSVALAVPGVLELIELLGSEGKGVLGMDPGVLELPDAELPDTPAVLLWSGDLELSLPLLDGLLPIVLRPGVVLWSVDPRSAEPDKLASVPVPLWAELPEPVVDGLLGLF